MEQQLNSYRVRHTGRGESTGDRTYPPQRDTIGGRRRTLGCCSADASPIGPTSSRRARSRTASGARWKEGKRRKLRSNSWASPGMWAGEEARRPFPCDPIRASNPKREARIHGPGVGQMKVSKVGQIRLSNAAESNSVANPPQRDATKVLPCGEFHALSSFRCSLST